MQNMTNKLMRTTHCWVRTIRDKAGVALNDGIKKRFLRTGQTTDLEEAVVSLRYDGDKKFKKLTTAIFHFVLYDNCMNSAANFYFKLLFAIQTNHKDVESDEKPSYWNISYIVHCFMYWCYFL